MKLMLFLTNKFQCNKNKIIGFLFLALWVASHSHSFPSESKIINCGVRACQLQCSSRNDARIGCEAIRRALLFFKTYGYDIETTIDMKFVINMTNSERKSQHTESDPEPFLCQYNNKTKCIKISSWESSARWNKKAFGFFSLDTEFFISMVTHELAHLFFESILESRQEKTNHPFHEFVAYATQIETMKNPNKSMILSLWPKERLPSVFAINSFVWMADPNKFSLLSYRLFKSQPEIIQGILDGRIKSVEMQFIMDY